MRMEDADTGTVGWWVDIRSKTITQEPFYTLLMLTQSFSDRNEHSFITITTIRIQRALKRSEGMNTQPASISL